MAVPSQSTGRRWSATVWASLAVAVGDFHTAEPFPDSHAYEEQRGSCRAAAPSASMRQPGGERVASQQCCKWPRRRQGDGVGSLKSWQTIEGGLRRETYRTAVGGDRGADR